MVGKASYSVWFAADVDNSGNAGIDDINAATNIVLHKY